jgi:hypothetical protein
MSDLYHETSETDTVEPDTGWEPAHDVGSQPEYERVEPAGQGYGEYTEADAEVQARIAGQDELPTREESRQATWGDDPDYYDEAELGAEYDGDVNAFLAGEDELPTPQESRAHTWGDNPDYYDETDLASEYDGDLGALTTGEDGPAARHAPASPETKDTHAEPAIAPEDTTDSRAQSAGADNRDQGAASTVYDQPDQAGTDLAATGPGLAPEAQDTADPSADVEPGQLNDAGLSRGDVGKPVSPEAAQLTALEAERDEARQEIAGLKAENAEQAALIKQLLGDTDRYQGGEASTPDHGADESGTSRDQDASLDSREGTDQGIGAIEAEHARWRRAASAENVGAVSTLLGAADMAMHGMPAVAVALGATAIGVASWAQAKIEKHRKEKP